MNSPAWPPHVTVATLVPRAGKFLFVLENTDQGERINQPAGHLEPGETLAQAAVRETLEETGWEVRLTGFLGVASYHAANGHLYLRNTFVAEPLRQRPDFTLDRDIIEPIWLTPEALALQKARWRSPLVGDVIDLYLRHGAQALELGDLHR